MTQEQKDLLLKDLSARLPYEVKVYDTKSNINNSYMNLCHVNGIIGEVFISSGWQCRTAPIEEIKPYLFPMSSVTEEQKKVALFDLNMVGYTIDKEGYIESDEDINTTFLNINHIIDFINWCYENHIDINGLIPKDLAIDATGLNIY